jgi:two-component system chemotaxis sensor kinase CheA
MANDPKFAEQLKQAFIQEAQDQIANISKGLLELEKNPGEARKLEIVERIFREAHNLKGSARATDFLNVERVCQSLETLFSALKKRQIDISSAGLDVVHKAITLIESLIAAGDRLEGDGQSERLEGLIAELELLALADSQPLDGKQRLETASGLEKEEKRAHHKETNSLPRPKELNILPSSKKKTTTEVTEGGQSQPASASPAGLEQSTAQAPQPTERTVGQETIRLAMSKLDALLLQAEELLSLKEITKQHAVEALNLHSLLEEWEKESTSFSQEFKAFENLLDRSVNGDFAFNQKLKKFRERMEKLARLHDAEVAQISVVRAKLTELVHLANNDMKTSAAALEDFLFETKKLLMMPAATLLDLLPKTVRELSRELGKEVEFNLSGNEIQLDKRILTQLKDPILHIIRNCLVHGIEKPEERAEKGKPPTALLTLAIKQVEASLVEIRITDDGAGIDIEKVKAAAVKSGLITGREASNLTREQAISLIFQSSLSTSSMITELAGRGLGLAIVNDAVTRLGGHLLVETESDRGTCFQLFVPVTLASFRGTFVESGGCTLIVPTANLERVFRAKVEDVGSVEGQATVSLDNQVIPVYRLADVLEIRHQRKQELDSSYLTVVALRSGDKLIGLTVEEVLEEQEIVVKSLAKPLVNVRNIAGVSVVGGGKIVPVLNVADLFKSISRMQKDSRLTAKKAAPRAKNVLVADDTLTARLLLKNILESSGFKVRTANDGREAFHLLKQEKFDIVVSDIEMPEMTGFQLTEQIREDPELTEMPVILVTALASKEDRERGVKVGANAYFLKSSFDEANLLNVVNKLI